MEAILTGQVHTIMSEAAAFPTHLVKSHGSDRMEPHVGSWLCYIKLCVSLNCLGTCTAYFKRMLEEYNNAPVQSKVWIADSFIPPAISELGAEDAMCSPDTSTMFGEFFRFALDVYVNRTLTQGKGKFNISTLMTAVKRSNDADFITAKYVSLY